MSGKSSYPIITRSGGPVTSIGDAASTPLPSQPGDPRQDGQFEMPETPEQLEELFSMRMAAIASAAQSIRTPIRYYDANQSSSNEYENGGNSRPARIQEVPHISYRKTKSVSCDSLKANRLREHGNDNAKRRDMILKVLKTEDYIWPLTWQQLRTYSFCCQNQY